MHKFFCNYNNLTGKYELSQSKSNLFSNRAYMQAENTLLPQIKQDIQALYENIVMLKEKETNENRLNRLDETELMVSNLYYSLFAAVPILPYRTPSCNHFSHFTRVISFYFFYFFLFFYFFSLPQFSQTIVFTVSVQAS